MVAWIWPRGKPLLAAYEGFKLSKAQLQRTKGTTPPLGQEGRDASNACSGDSETALPRESQKDKRPKEVERDR